MCLKGKTKNKIAFALALLSVLFVFDTMQKLALRKFLDVELEKTQLNKVEKDILFLTKKINLSTEDLPSQREENELVDKRKP